MLFTHNFYIFMNSVKNLCLSEANFETVLVKVFNPYCHGILGPPGKLVTGSHKHSWRSPKRLKLKQRSIVFNQRKLPSSLYNLLLCVFSSKTSTYFFIIP